MKQHITVEQLNELSKELSKKLRVWIYKKTYEPPEVSNDESMLLSIGQMIEFLEEHYLYWGIYPRWSKRKRCKECDYGWKIAKDEHPTYIVWADSMEAKQPQEIHAAKDTLCDALWGAVKEVLNKEDHV